MRFIDKVCMCDHGGGRVGGLRAGGHKRWMGSRERWEGGRVL